MVQQGGGAAAPTQSARRSGKSASAFRTISEVARELDLPQHVLRFWETKFVQVSPLKRGGGRRYYRPEDIDLLSRIRDLLHRDGYTIKGVQKLFVEESAVRKRGGDIADGAKGSGPDKTALRGLIGEMEDQRDRLLAVVGR